MTFPPIVERELRTAARKHPTYSIRVVIALVAIATGVYFYGVHPRLAPQTVAQRFFQGLTALGMIYCLSAGRRWTADCISAEKREGTLGLLFLTTLKGRDIVFGKLAATSLNGLYGIIAMFPVLAIPLMMGGVSHAEFWRAVLVLVNTILLSLSVGLFASVISTSARQAFGLNFLILLLVVVGSPAVGLLVAYYTPSHSFYPRWFFTCPIYSIYASADILYLVQRANFWWSMVIQHSLTWLLLFGASRLAPRTWPTDGRAASLPIWNRLFGFGAPALRRAHRARLLAINPFYWLASRVPKKPVLVWTALVLLGSWWLLVCFVVKIEWFNEAFAFVTVLLLNLFLKAFVAIESVQRFAEDKETGALELILSTPLPVRQILRGQLHALKRLFGGPFLLAIALEVILTIALARKVFMLRSQVIAFGSATLFMLLCDIAALVWAGMLSGLVARTANRASVRTIIRILIFPWLVFLPVAVFIAIWTSVRGGNSPEWDFYLTLWLLLGLAADVIFGLPAWWQLRRNFRRLALEQVVAAR